MKKELEQAEKDWSVLNPQHRAELKERWDGKATSWEQELRSNEEKRQHHENRILSTIDWLETFGLFRGDCDVTDIGCGPGRFVAEFAKKSRYAVGLDISPKMIEYGANYAREQGMDNAEFFVEDFASMDIVARGWEKRFDLAFSSITPAIRGKEGLENLMAISRKWCFNSCFVNFSNDLHKDIMNDLFQRRPKREKALHSQWFKQLFDLLWLRGYHPYVHYFKEHREECHTVDRVFAENNASFLLEENASKENIERIFEYLEAKADKDGKVSFASECWYGWLLWDVNDRIDR